MIEEVVTEPVMEPVVESGSAEETPKEPTRDEVRHKNDLLKFKQERNVLQEENAKLKRAAQEREVNSLRQKEEYKTLAEQFEARAIEAEQKNENNYQMYLGDKKRTAVEQEALKLGIKPSYMKFLHAESADNVEVETTSTGNVNVHGAKEFVEDFKSRHVDLFKGQQAPVINGANPQVVVGKTLSNSELLALQKTDKARYNEEIRKRLGRK